MYNVCNEYMWCCFVSMHISSTLFFFLYKCVLSTLSCVFCRSCFSSIWLHQYYINIYTAYVLFFFQLTFLAYLVRPIYIFFDVFFFFSCIYACFFYYLVSYIRMMFLFAWFCFYKRQDVFVLYTSFILVFFFFTRVILFFACMFFFFFLGGRAVPNRGCRVQGFGVTGERARGPH